MRQLFLKHYTVYEVRYKLEIPTEAKAIDV